MYRSDVIVGFPSEAKRILWILYLSISWNIILHVYLFEERIQALKLSPIVPKHIARAFKRLHALSEIRDYFYDSFVKESMLFLKV